MRGNGVRERCAEIAEDAGENDPHNHLYEGSKAIAAAIRKS